MFWRRSSTLKNLDRADRLLAESGAKPDSIEREAVALLRMRREAGERMPSWEGLSGRTMARSVVSLREERLLLGAAVDVFCGRLQHFIDDTKEVVDRMNSGIAEMKAGVDDIREKLRSSQ